MRMLYTFILSLMLSVVSTAKAQMKWMNPMDGETPNICGRAWNGETGKTYNRLLTSSLRHPRNTNHPFFSAIMHINELFLV